MAKRDARLRLNAQIAFTNPSTTHAPSCPLIWDLRDPPATAAQPVPTYPSHPPYSSHPQPRPPTAHKPHPALPSEYATAPPVRALNITCGLAPAWKITAQNPRGGGVTVADVLRAVHAALHAPLAHGEWAALAGKQRARVAAAYEERWRGAADPAGERMQGLRRVDALLGCTRFGGLIVADGRGECVLSLTRNTMG
ncbi:hypothetical protein HWV62_35272 [Athelia sp. TMB]|nr:hypothetical protein HWV62_35272 [Athelia sp. TMB]